MSTTPWVRAVGGGSTPWVRAVGGGSTSWGRAVGGGSTSWVRAVGGGSTTLGSGGRRRGPALRAGHLLWTAPPGRMPRFCASSRDECCRSWAFESVEKTLCGSAPLRLCVEIEAQLTTGPKSKSGVGYCEPAFTPWLSANFVARS